MTEDKNPQKPILNKIPFYVGDAVLVIFGLFMAFSGDGPITMLEAGIATVSVVAGAVLLVAPFYFEFSTYARLHVMEHDEAADQRLRKLDDLITLLRSNQKHKEEKDEPGGKLGNNELAQTIADLKAALQAFATDHTKAIAEIKETSAPEPKGANPQELAELKIALKGIQGALEVLVAKSKEAPEKPKEDDSSASILDKLSQIEEHIKELEKSVEQQEDDAEIEESRPLPVGKALSSAPIHGGLSALKRMIQNENSGADKNEDDTEDEEPVEQEDEVIEEEAAEEKPEETDAEDASEDKSEDDDLADEPEEEETDAVDEKSDEADESEEEPKDDSDDDGDSEEESPAGEEKAEEEKEISEPEADKNETDEESIDDILNAVGEEESDEMDESDVEKLKEEIQSEINKSDEDEELPDTEKQVSLLPEDETVDADDEATEEDNRTRIIVHAMIGIGNKPYIRGEGAGMNDKKGVVMKFLEIGKWEWVAPETNDPLVFKIYLNDDLPSEGDEFIAHPGETLSISPRFKTL